MTALTEHVQQVPLGLADLDLAIVTETVSWLEGRLGKRLTGALLRAGRFPG